MGKKLTGLSIQRHRDRLVRAIILLLQLHFFEVLERAIPALAERNHRLVVGFRGVALARQGVDGVALPEVEEDALRLLQHGVVGGFDGCEEGWDVGGFDGHLHVEDEGEGLDFLEGWWGRHCCGCGCGCFW